VGDEFTHFGTVGEIAATFAGNAKFAPGQGHLFQQQGASAGLCGLACSHEASGAAADNDNIRLSQDSACE
jgi:hypothetical protein